VQRVLADSAYWKARQIEILSVGPQPGLGCVEIGVDQPDRDRAT
jgi:hypothetical protein